MTDTETKTVEPATEATEATAEAISKDAEKMRDRYDDKGKLVIVSRDQIGAFEEFLGSFDETDPLQNWAEKAPDDGTFTGAAVVKTESGKNRFIMLPSRDAFMSSVNAMNWAFTQFIRKIVNVAGSDDAGEHQFVVVDGCIKAKYDPTAFKKLAMKAVKWLREQGLTGMTVPGLKMALKSEAYAAASFPKVKKQEKWEGLIQRMVSQAEAKGYDTSELQLWLATRKAAVIDTSETDGDFDLDDFASTMEDEAETETSEAAE